MHKTTLDVGEYNSSDDSITIEGTKYAGSLFRELGFNFLKNIGDVLQIVEKKDGTVTLHRIDLNNEDKT